MRISDLSGRPSVSERLCNSVGPVSGSAAHECMSHCATGPRRRKKYGEAAAAAVTVASSAGTLPGSAGARELLHGDAGRRYRLKPGVGASGCCTLLCAFRGELGGLLRGGSERMAPFVPVDNDATPAVCWRRCCDRVAIAGGPALDGWTTGSAAAARCFRCSARHLMSWARRVSSAAPLDELVGGRIAASSRRVCDRYT